MSRLGGNTDNDQGLMHGLKQEKFGTMVIMECKYKLDTTTQAAEDTIKWFHSVFVSQLVTSSAHGGVPGYHTVLVEQHMTLIWKKLECR